MPTPSNELINISDLWSAIPGVQARAALKRMDPIRDAARLGLVSHCLDLCGGRLPDMAAALQAALQERRLPLAIALLEAGAWIGPAPEASTPATVAGVESAAPSPAVVEQWSLLALHAPDAASLLLLLSAMERSGRAVPGPELLAGIALSQFDYAKALEILDGSNIPLGEDLFGQLAAQARVDGSSLLKPFWAVFNRHGTPSVESIRQQQALAELLFNRAPTDLPSFLRAILWHHAIGGENYPMIGRLAAGGHFPEEWACPDAEMHEPRWLRSGSFLSRSFLKFPEGASFFSQIPAAVADARKRPPAPEFTSNLHASSLVSMAALGIDIAAKNAEGKTFLHLWAADPIVRPGWAWVAKTMPELLRQADNAGSSPIDIQRSVLASSPKKQQRFDEMIAGFERAVISKAVALAGGPGKRATASSPKPRL